MKVNINGIIVRDLERFSYNGCELSFRFSENHSYIIAEFLQLMNELFNGSCRYHYRGHLDEDIEAIEYIDEQNKIYEEIWEQYDGEIPDDVKKEFYSKVDKDKVNVLDEEFMQDVLTFYESAITE